MEPGTKYYSSEISKNLYLGGANASLDLQRLQITHIVCVGSELKVESPEQFVYLHLPILDDEKFPIERYFDIFNAFVSAALNSGGRVMVHCADSRSSSVTMVVQYLFATTNLNAKGSLNYVAKVHPCALPNKGFIEKIYQLE